MESDPDFTSNGVTREQFSYILDVLNQYDTYSTGELVSQTHRSGTPWAHRKSDKERIDAEDIREYFVEHEKRVVPLVDIIRRANIPTIGYMNDKGVLVLPAEENDDEWDDLDEM